MSQDVRRVCTEIAERAKGAALGVSQLSGGERATLLREIAASLRDRAGAIIEANRQDLDLGTDLTSALRDRLRLDEQRIASMARAVEQIADQPDPVGRVMDGRVLPNGIRLEKRRVPIGVILMIYESRPNVTSDAAALCLKAGNAVVLRGGKEAAHSNRAIAEAVRGPLAARRVADAVSLVPTTDRQAIPELLRLRGLIDLCVPRGGPSLMRAVTEAAHIPVVKHDAGNCHVYLDEHLDGLERTAIEIVVNAKTQRPGVCNAVETLLIHEAVTERILPALGAVLADEGVELRADERARPHLPNPKEATEEDWATEYLDLILAIRVVDSLEQACEHIRRWGSSHTEAIVTSSIVAADRFRALVDSANVMINCSTRFADGGEYGLGAEIGISTDKLHARGPMGAEDLTTFQWVLTGRGQIRT